MPEAWPLCTNANWIFETRVFGEVEKKSSYTEKDIKNLNFMGLVGFIDPIRTDAIKAINDSINAGVNVLMITGDHPLTAFSIAKDLKLTNTYDEVTTGVDLVH